MWPIWARFSGTGAPVRRFAKMATAGQTMMPQRFWKRCGDGGGRSVGTESCWRGSDWALRADVDAQEMGKRLLSRVFKQQAVMAAMPCAGQRQTRDGGSGPDRGLAM